MGRPRYIISLVIGLFWISCTKVPVFQESLVPEIISITSIPETHSAVLTSDLNTAPYGKVECGFYIGTNKTDLKRVRTSLKGRSFTMMVEGLEEGTLYYFKAFISNGINEIASGFESFITETEPVQNPTEPEEPIEPENPEEPEEPTEPEEPEEPVEFSTEIISLSATVSDHIAEFTAELSGDISLVTECWFMVGFTADKLSKIKGTIEGGAVKAYLAGLEPGVSLWYKAVISNGTEVKESDMKNLNIE